MRPGMKTRFNVRYSLYSFSDDVHRDRLDGEIMRVLQIKPRARLTVGWRTNLMWHDQETSDFYSPAQFQSYLAVGQAEGRITRTLGYSGEIAAGWQFESNSPSLHPFQAMGKLNWQTSRRLNAVLEAGKSTSSLDRPSSGARAYSRWVVSAGLEFRIPLSD